MSEPVKITSFEKTKDPRRVEAGKKLGAISKQAKEKKAQRHVEEDMQKSVDKPCGEFSSLAAVLAGAVVIGAIVLHYKSSSKEPSKEPSKEDHTVQVTILKNPIPKRKLDSLD